MQIDTIHLYPQLVQRFDYEDFSDQFNNDGIDDVDSDDEEQQTLRRKIHMIEMPLPDVEKSLIGPEIFNILYICFNSVNQSVPYNFFKYALVSCPNLAEFTLERFNTPSFNIRAAPRDYYYRVPLESTTTQDNLKVVKLLEGIVL